MFPTILKPKLFKISQPKQIAPNQLMSVILCYLNFRLFKSKCLDRISLISCMQLKTDAERMYRAIQYKNPISYGMFYLALVAWTGR